MELLWLTLPLPILLFAIFWLLRSTKAYYRQCVSQYQTAISHNQSIIEMIRENMVLQRDINRLLGELIETLKTQQR